jgi:hypothetical protein
MKHMKKLNPLGYLLKIALLTAISVTAMASTVENQLEALEKVNNYKSN